VRSKLVSTQLILFVVIAVLGLVYVGAKYVRVDQLFGFGQYTVTGQFADSGGIFSNAEVTYRGIPVGRVGELKLTEQCVDVELKLEKSAPDVPADTIAVVANRSAIGEQYVDLQPRTDQGPFLQDGDVIPLERTTPADNVEDVLRGLSEVVAGGHIVDFQRSIDRFNRAIPPDPATVDLINDKAREALRDLATNTTELDRILGGAEAVTRSFAEKTDTLDTILTSGPERVAGLADALLVVVDALIDLGYMSRNIGAVINPVAGDLHDVIATLQPMIRTLATADLTAPMLASRMDALLREKLVPFFTSSPNVRIASVSGDTPAGEVPDREGRRPADGLDRADEMIQVLRSIGFVR